jgi:hypothetical protein
MFCPLCHSEFRDAIEECSDCHVPLVLTLEEARSRSIRFWHGQRQSELDRTLAILDAAQIPSHFKETAHLQPQVNILGFNLFPRQPMFQYDIWIFREDLEKAEAAVRGTNGN